MMHTFRLLEMAIEIARDNRINVRRNDRDFLLSVKNGEYKYDELLKMANEKQNEMEAAFEKSTLAEQPNLNLLENLSYELRASFYKEM